MALRDDTTRTHVRQVSESARERETVAYAESVLRTAQQRSQKDRQELTTSPDAILTAFAQLASFRTGTSTSLISVFDKAYQYVAAEATPSTSLVPGACGHKLSVCCTAIPREESLCDLTVREGCKDLSIKSSPDGHVTGSQLPLTKIEELGVDGDLCFRPFRLPNGKLARFYAAVPIRTQRRINIGSLCVVHDEPVPRWTDEHGDVLREISAMIMKHWENVRASHAHRRSERMGRGMGSFLEDRSTISGWRDGRFPQAYEDQAGHEGALNKQQQATQKKTDDQLQQQPGDHDTEPPPKTATPCQQDVEEWIPAQAEESSSHRIQIFESLDQPHKRQLDIDKVFDKAANIIRESLEIEGCVFIDPTLTTYGSLVDSSRHRANPASEQSSGGEDSRVSDSETTLQYCRTLGFSTSQSHSINGDVEGPFRDAIAQKLVAALLQRYPQGKIFNFDSNGDLLSSDSSDDSTTLPAARALGKNPWAREQEGKTISGLFPGARSVIFTPIWDSRKDMWFAVSFAFTLSANRVFTVQGELTYLRAFGMLAMEHVLRLETMHNDKAKADVLSCISHELRSPLHGILLSTELLNDTVLNATQGNMVHSLETCSRTMLDTVDHLLDFSNINNISRQNRRLPPNRGLRSTEIAKSPIKLHTLVEEVIDSVFAGFQFQYHSVRQLRRNSQNDDGHNYMDGMRAAEERATLSSDASTLNGVQVFFMVDPRCQWSFSANSGALRRIIMNLFGNALKYTPTGMIKVSLAQRAAKDSRKRSRQVVITVADTGIGMSQDYQHTQLFRPFAQENSLSSGTGLGLSLVRQLVSQLRGRISVDSRVGSGTTVTVSLPLKLGLNAQGLTAGQEDGSTLKFEEQARLLRGLRIRLLGFPGDRAASPGRTTSGDDGDTWNTMQSICTDWLQLEVVTDEQAGTIMPDLVLMSAGSGFEHDAALKHVPTVVVCNNAVVAYEQSSSFTNHDRLVEFVSQPVGPYKLTRILSQVFDRWRSMQEFPLLAPTTTASPSAGGGTSNGVDKVSNEQSPWPEHPCNGRESISNEPAPQPQSAQNLPIRPTSSREASASTGDPHFLLVDDNAINLKILKTYMTKLKCSFSGATNGQEAVDGYKKLLGERRCVLMDISMPVMDGLEATRRIRAFEASQEIQPALIIALTGLGSQKAQQEAFSSGVELFLTKPVQLKELGNILRSRGLIS